MEAAINRIAFRLTALRKRHNELGVAIAYVEQEAAIILDRWNESQLEKGASANAHESEPDDLRNRVAELEEENIGLLNRIEALEGSSD